MLAETLCAVTLAIQSEPPISNAPQSPQSIPLKSCLPENVRGAQSASLVL